MPDAVAVIADYLRSELEGVPVVSRVPNPRPGRFVQVCRALIAALRGVTGGVTVYGSAEVGGPQWLPDPDSSQPRYALAVQVHMRGRVLER